MASNGKEGVDIDFFNEDPLKNPKAKSRYHIVGYALSPICRYPSTTHYVSRSTTNLFFRDGLPSVDVFGLTCWAEITGRYTPDASGNVSNMSPLYVDDTYCVCLARVWSCVSRSRRSIHQWDVSSCSTIRSIDFCLSAFLCSKIIDNSTNPIPGETFFNSYVCCHRHSLVGP